MTVFAKKWFEMKKVGHCLGYDIKENCPVEPFACRWRNSEPDNRINTIRPCR